MNLKMNLKKMKNKFGGTKNSSYICNVTIKPNEKQPYFSINIKH